MQHSVRLKRGHRPIFIVRCLFWSRKEAVNNNIISCVSWWGGPETKLDIFPQTENSGIDRGNNPPPYGELSEIYIPPGLSRLVYHG